MSCIWVLSYQKNLALLYLGINSRSAVDTQYILCTKRERVSNVGIVVKPQHINFDFGAINDSVESWAKKVWCELNYVYSKKHIGCNFNFWDFYVNSSIHGNDWPNS